MIESYPIALLEHKFMSHIEDQMIDLQTQLSYQEDTIQQLNDVVSLQQQDIMQLKQQLALLLAEIKSSLESGQGAGTAGGSLFDERPPHY